MKYTFPIVLLLSAAVSATNAFACMDGIETDEIRGTHRFELSDGSARLVYLRQNNEDVRVLVTSTLGDDGSGQVLDSPIGRNGVEFIYLEAPVGEARSYQVCVFPTYNGAFRGTYEIQEFDVSHYSTNVREQLRNINQAGDAWALDTPDSRKHSISLYADIISASAVAFPIINQYSSLYLAIANIQHNNYPESQSLLTPLSNNSDDIYVQFRSIWLLGLALVRQGQFENGLQQLHLATETAMLAEGILNISLQNDLAEIDNLIGEVYLNLNNIELGETYLLRAQQGAQEEYQLLGKIYNNLGYLELKKSSQTGLEENQKKQHLILALDEHLKARLFSLQAGDNVELAAIENNLAYISELLGELRNAHQHYREALRIHSSSKDDFGLMVLLNNIGIISKDLGDYPKSESYLRQALNIASSFNLSFRLVMHCSLGTTLRLLGKIGEAREQHNLCASQGEGRDRDGQDRQLLAFLELSEDFKAAGNDQEAWRFIEQARARLNADTPQEISLQVKSGYAFLLHLRGRSDEALTVIEAVLDESNNENNRLSIIEISAVYIQVLAELGRRDEAISLSYRLLEEIELVYTELEAERLGPSWSAKTHESYVFLAELLIEEYFSSNNNQSLISAFEVVDRSRAISIRQQFSRELPQDIQRIEESHRLDLLSQIANDNAGIQLNNISASLPASYYQQHDLISLSRLSGIETLPIPDLISLPDIQAELTKSQAVLYYLVADLKAYVFILTKDNLQLAMLGSTAQLDFLTGNTLAKIRNSDSAYENLSELAEFLLGPVNLSGIDDLIIVPHKKLHNFPFSALPLTVNSSGYVPLMSEFSLTTVPSLSALFMEKNKVTSPFYMDVAVLADPVFVKEQLENDLSELSGDEKVQKWSDQLYPLPYTALEAQNLTNLFPAEQVLALTGEMASRKNLLSTPVRNSRILHIATHGYFNSFSDDNVGLALSAEDQEGGSGSGFITLPDLFGYSFNNELVVISGCDTTMGRALSGEGMMGISRGFIAQGAKHVISTLWQVSDRASAVFMEAFYRHLLELGNVAQALQAAQQDLQRNPDYRNPYYWAAYILTSVSHDQKMIFQNSNPDLLAD